MVINLQFVMADGSVVVIYDVHPRSQEEPITLPKGAVTVTVWLGTRKDENAQTPLCR